MTSSPHLHVAFCASSAGLLRQVFTELRRDDRVLCLPDDLSIGPIAPADPTVRARWVDKELGLDYPLASTDGTREEHIAQIEAFWAETTTSSSSPIVWFSRRSVSEYTGFLELLWRRPDLQLVDVTDVVFVRHGAGRVDPSTCVAFIPHTQIIKHRLYDRAELVTAPARDEARAIWQRLATENSALRILGAPGLLSRPIAHFDDVILSCTTDAWRRCSAVIGESIGRISDDPYLQTGRDQFIWYRVQALIEDEILEGRGDLFDYRDSFVRRPARAEVDV